MPLYEYRCSNCHRRVTLLIRNFSESSSITCPNCGSTELNRLFSTFAVSGDKSAYEDILADPQLVKGLEYDDPRALAEWNRRMSRGLDEEITPEYEEMLERMGAGEMPDDLMGGEETSEEL